MLDEEAEKRHKQEIKYQRANLIARIIFIIISLSLGISVWYVGLGPSAEKIKFCYSISGLPTNQITALEQAKMKNGEVCVTCYEIMKEKAQEMADRFNNLSQSKLNYRAMDNLRSLNLTVINP